jgi:hypothetical protein
MNKNIITSLKKSINGEESILQRISKLDISLNESSKTTDESFDETYTIENIQKIFDEKITHLKKETDDFVSKIDHNNITFLTSIAVLLAKYKHEFLKSEEFQNLYDKNNKIAYDLFEALFGTASAYNNLYEEYYKKNGIISQVQNDFNHQFVDILKDKSGLSGIFGIQNGVMDTAINQISTINTREALKEIDIKSFYKDIEKPFKGNKIELSNIQIDENTAQAISLMAIQANPQHIGMLAALGDDGVDFDSSQVIGVSGRAVAQTVGRVLIAATFIIAVVAIFIAATYFAAGLPIIAHLGILAGAGLAEYGLIQGQKQVMKVESLEVIDPINAQLTQPFVRNQITAIKDYITRPIEEDKAKQQYELLKHASDNISSMKNNVYDLSNAIQETMLNISNASSMKKLLINSSTKDFLQSLRDIGIRIENSKAKNISL